METFADRLTTLRKEHNLTVTETCELLDVPYGTYYHWANGDSFPRPDAIKKIAEAFNVTTEYLMRGEHKDASKIEKEEKKPAAVSCAQPKTGYINSPTRDAIYPINGTSIRYRSADENKLKDINVLIEQIKYMNVSQDRKKSIHKLLSEYRTDLECKVFYGDSTM